MLEIKLSYLITYSFLTASFTKHCNLEIDDHNNIASFRKKILCENTTPMNTHPKFLDIKFGLKLTYNTHIENRTANAYKLVTRHSIHVITILSSKRPSWTRVGYQTVTQVNGQVNYISWVPTYIGFRYAYLTIDT